MTFWTRLSKKKLEELKLDNSVLRIGGAYTTARHSTIPSRMQLNADSLMDSKDIGGACDAAANSLGPEFTPVTGHLHNCNTKEEFAKLDKKKLAADLGQEVRQTILLR